jgi:hypothetical protein
MVLNHRNDFGHKKDMYIRLDCLPSRKHQFNRIANQPTLVDGIGKSNFLLYVPSVVRRTWL